MRWIPTTAHSVLDYLSVVTLLALPRLLHWSANLTSLITFLAIGTLIYTVLTRFEGGLVRVLPTKVHLLIDFLAGLGLASTPLWLFAAADQTTKTILVGFGLFEVLVALMTRTHSRFETGSGESRAAATGRHASV